MPAIQRIDALARALDLSPATLRREIARGRLPAHRCGRILLFTEEDVAEYLKRCALSAGPEA